MHHNGEDGKKIDRIYKSRIVRRYISKYGAASADTIYNRSCQSSRNLNENCTHTTI